MKAAVIVMAALGGFAAPGWGQEGDVVSRGTRVRVESYGASSRRVEGKVMSVNDETLTLVTERPDTNHTGVARFRIADIRNIEVWRGDRRTGHVGKAFRTGFGIGAALGLGVGGLLRGFGGFDSQGSPNRFTKAPVYGAVLGGAGGGLLLMAMQVGSRVDVWEPASVPNRAVQLSLGPAPGRGWQAGVAVRF